MSLQLDCQLDFIYIFFIFQSSMLYKKLSKLIYQGGVAIT